MVGATCASQVPKEDLTEYRVSTSPSILYMMSRSRGLKRCVFVSKFLSLCSGSRHRFSELEIENNALLFISRLSNDQNSHESAL